MDLLVLAIAAGDKLVTRRIIAPKLGKFVRLHADWQDRAFVDGTREHGYLHVPTYWVDEHGATTDTDTWDRVHMRAAPGDIMDVCEALVPGDSIGEWNRRPVLYRCDSAPVLDEDGERFPWTWRTKVLPGRYCPTRAVRHHRPLVSVRPERLSDVTDAEAVLEGIRYLGWPETRAGFIAGFCKMHKLESDRIWIERREWARGEGS